MLQQFLVLDTGNSATKIGYFSGDQLVEVWRVSTQALIAGRAPFTQLLSRDMDLKVGWINVAADIEMSQLEIWNHFRKKPVFVRIDAQYPFPVVNKYETPLTLGSDRITGVIGARSLFTSVALLVIDIGTAITYDYMTDNDLYLGGGISPGMSMRFKSLHAFTAKLPLVEAQKNIPLIGNTSADSIRSGVVHGISTELNGIIQAYHHEVGEHMKIVLTGGDMPFFEKRIKYPNFTEQHLVLIGIKTLLSDHS